MKCWACKLFYEKTEGKMVDDHFFCYICIPKLQPQGEYSNVSEEEPMPIDIKPCIACHEKTTEVLLREIEVYKDDVNHTVEDMCIKCSNSFDLGEDNDHVARCYTCLKQIWQWWTFNPRLRLPHASAYSASDPQ